MAILGRLTEQLGDTVHCAARHERAVLASYLPDGGAGEHAAAYEAQAVA